MPSAHAITDHDEIREWAEARGARPACVKGTGRRGDTGMIRLDFPGFSGRESLQPVSWNQWFKSFDENNLALLVQDRTARGQRSNFNKLVDRDTAAGRQKSRRSSARSLGSSRSRSSTGARTRSERSPSRAHARSQSARRSSTRRSSTRSERTTAADTASRGRTKSRNTQNRTRAGSRTKGRSGKSRGNR